MKKYIILLHCLIFIVLAGCSLTNTMQTTDSASINNPLLVQNPKDKTQTGVEFGGFVEFPNGMTKEDFNKEFINIQKSKDNEAFRELAIKIFDLEDKWDQVDNLLREYIQKTENTTFAWYHHQLIAATALERFLVTRPVSTNVQKQIEFYLNILLRYNNDNEVIGVAKALPMLEGYWTNSQIAKVAMMYYKGFNSQVPPSTYVYRGIAARSEKIAKKFPEKYSTTESITGKLFNIEVV